MKVLPAVVVALLVLTGCGSDRPGAAAVVEGRTISMAEADRTAEVFCSLSLLSAQQQGGQVVDNAEVRRQAVAELVLAEVAQDVAEREGIEVRDAEVRMSAAERSQVAESVPGDPAEVVEVIEASRRTFAIAQALGEAATGDRSTSENSDQLQQAGRAVLDEELAAADVRFDPRFGLGRDGQQVASTGSLSVSPEDLEQAAPEDVPATSRCA